ncbi:WD40 repeat domain-containing serine/threonine-protein kinase [Frigoriglobus tundricola]|uniref:Serine/threonine protein kinase n=1 Tax=Frigoriglobus tundricola TaxID=2774151 RepID=A0A6M5YZP7_9BACT|nr:WD40 repeat domain-containing serine/threonine-protein kinase [Frigoriglobus tundricola]QJW98402.1 Serine/threonine protein kinase [Frigoriglobus tundricola]
MTVPNIDEELVFNTARKIGSPEARSSYLDQVCGGNTVLRKRVQALLGVHERDDFLTPPTAPAGRVITEGPGSTVGPYKLLEQIGEGGFGVVFMAEQQRPIRRKVALKVLKPGMDTRRVVARFEAERQALALMEHQNIARVLDAGETATNRPYFVMELVRGTPITTFCDESHLFVRERLRLFLEVCQAVQHAHQKGIIHRDLKPSNILVTLHDGTPVPKVIDFGIAKAMGQQLTEKTLFTGFGQMIGTPSYMSPEQAEMSGLDVDTRSDIFALGILLYELLTGGPPCDQERVRTAALDEIRRIIREEEPARPSTRISALGKRASTVSANRRSDPLRLSQLYRGELDWIVMKALEKDRNRRYETAAALAADVHRYLNNEPVSACPPSTWYRARKVVQRHRSAAAAASSVVLALVVGTIAATWGWIRAADAETTARKEASGKEEALKEREGALAVALHSEREAREQLFLSLLNQARAVRFSRQMGQRLDSLDIVTRAAQIRTDARLRDEALAALAHPDLKPGTRWRALPPGFKHLHFDADYRLYARASDQGIISVRTVTDDREVQCIRTAPVQTNLVRLSPDGRYVARLGTTLRVWRVADGVEALSERPARIGGLAFSRDSRYLIVGRGNAVIRFDLATGREVNRWRCPEKTEVWSVAFHPDNKRAAVCYADAEVVSIYDTETGEPVAHLPVGPTAAAVAAWHPDGSRLAVGSTDFIQVWDLETRSKRAQFEGRVQPVESLSFHPNGSLLASRSWDGVLRLLDASTGRAVLEMPLLVDPQFSRDGRWLGVLQHGEDAQLLEAVTAPEYRTLGEGGDYLDGDLSPDNRLLAVSCGGLGIRIWDLAHDREVANLAGGLPLFRPDGREFFVCDADGLHRRTMNFDRDLHLGPPRTVPLPAKPTRVSCSRDGRTLAMVSEVKGFAWLVDLDTDTVQEQRFNHLGAGYVSLSPDGNWLATSGWHTSEVRLWNARTDKQPAHKWQLHERATVTFTPDSRVLVLGLGHEFRFHDITNKELVFRISREVAMHPGFVAFAPAAGLMALELAPGVVHLKEIATGRTVARLEDPHGDRASWLGLTPEGGRLAVVSPYARAVHVWGLRSIRERLKAMNLDWDWPEFPTSPK